MFGALNRFISRLDSESPSQRAGRDHGGFGFQVLRNKDPELPIEPWFDFIIGINGRQIDDPDPHLFAQEIRNCAGAVVTLGIWSAKGQRIRELHISVPSDPPLLGLTLQWTAISSTEDVWHILEVSSNSPAEEAGLIPYGDYIIGTPEGIVRGEAGMGELIEDHISRSLILHIYNHEFDLTRQVTITPSRHWGGDGALGCTLGYGALHRLPVPLHEPAQAPGETLFETVSFNPTTMTTTTTDPQFLQPSASSPPPLPHPSSSSSSPSKHLHQPSHLLIPAEHIPDKTTPTTTTTTTKSHRGKSHRHAAPLPKAFSPNRSMDEYFREGEAKSRELDASSPSPRMSSTSSVSSNVKNALPPPPKRRDV